MRFFPFTDVRNTSISSQHENDIGLDGVFLGITDGVFYGDITLQCGPSDGLLIILTSVKGKKRKTDFLRHVCNTNIKKWHISMYI